LQQFEVHLLNSALAPATITNYLADLRAFLRWGERRNGAAPAPFSLVTTDLKEYCAYLEENKGHTPATINRRIQALRKFYELATTEGWIRSNPAERVPLLREVSSERSRSLTQQDIDHLLSAVRCGRSRWIDRDWAIIQSLVGAGLKLSELTELRLDDVSLDAGEPCFHVSGSTGAPGRIVPLDAEVQEAVRVYLSKRQATLGVDHVYVNRDGNPLSTRSVQRLLHHYAKAAGLECLTAQALRYVYATRVYESSGDPQAVAGLLGHRHLATTIRYLRPSSPQRE
jgi:site-specific recombinase XerD